MISQTPSFDPLNRQSFAGIVVGINQLPTALLSESESSKLHKIGADKPAFRKVTRYWPEVFKYRTALWPNHASLWSWAAAVPRSSWRKARPW